MEDLKDTFDLNCYDDEPVKVAVRKDRYTHGGGLAVQLVDAVDGSPFATVSVNVPGITLADDEFVFKTYSENEGLLEAMIAAGFVEYTGRMVDIGPICRLLRGEMQEVWAPAPEEPISVPSQLIEIDEEAPEWLRKGMQ